MATDTSLEALAALARTALRLVPPEELLEELAPFFQKKPGVVKVVEQAPPGSVGRFCSQLCLLPGRRFELGKRVSVEVLPMPPGLPWTCWAVEASEEPEGWSHVERAAVPSQATPPRRSFKSLHPERKENDVPWRSGRQRP
jgi:hypothetical protein